MKKNIIAIFFFFIFPISASGFTGDFDCNQKIELQDVIYGLQVLTGARSLPDVTGDAITNSIGMRFVKIPAGTFAMGSSLDELGRGPDETLHTVRLTQDFYLSATEVTQAQWEAVMPSNPSDGGIGDILRGNFPVDSVTHEDALSFIAALEAREPGSDYSLPTEAQWEYAARAESNAAFFNGDISNTGSGYDPNLSEIGWYSFNSEGNSHPVGTKRPNSYGIYDMSGNVFEWVQDNYIADNITGLPVNDPIVVLNNSFFILRGGHFLSPIEDCRAASRTGYSSTTKSPSIGFRLVANVVESSCEFQIGFPSGNGFYASGENIQTGNLFSTFTVNTSGNCFWSAESGSDWIQLGATYSGTGTRTVQFTVESNDGDEARQGTIRVGGKSFSITQEPVCQYNVYRNENSSEEVTSLGEVPGAVVTGTLYVAQEGNNCGSWVVNNNNVDWIDLNLVEGSFTENGTIEYTIHENPVVGIREANFTVAGNEISLKQGVNVISHGEPKTPIDGNPEVKFVRIPKGTFTMGTPSDELQRSPGEVLHEVILTKDFYIMTTEVTEKLWMSITGTDVYQYNDSPCGEDCPAVNLNNILIDNFINRLNNSQNDGIVYRLPTEAEWEYAARAGTKTAFPSGEMESTFYRGFEPALDRIGWFYNNAQYDIKPVRQKIPNNWGIYDMAGNAWELVQDFSGPYPTGRVTDPVNLVPGDYRIIRGGSYYAEAFRARSGHRGYVDDEIRKKSLGFRLVFTAEQ